MADDQLVGDIHLVWSFLLSRAEARSMALEAVCARRRCRVPESEDYENKLQMLGRSLNGRIFHPFLERLPLRPLTLVRRIQDQCDRRIALRVAPCR